MEKIDFKERDDLISAILGLSNGDIPEPKIHELISTIPKLFKFVKNPSKALEFLAVRMLGSNIRYVSEQTPILQELAIIDDIENIKYIDNPIKSVEKKAIDELPESIAYIKNPRDFSILVACTYPGLFRYVKDRSPYICEYAVKKNAENIAYVENPSLDLQRLAYHTNPELLSTIDKVDSGLLMEIIPSNPYIVTSLKNVTDLQYKMALKQEPLVLLQLEDSLIGKYKQFTTSVLMDTIDGNPDMVTADMIRDYPILILVMEYKSCFYEYLDIAISEAPEIAKIFPNLLTSEQKAFMLANNGWFIKYMDESEIDDAKVLLALSNNQDYCIQYIENPSLYIQLYAVEEHAKNIKYVNNPDERVINLAITKSPFSIKYIDNPSEFICCKAIRKDPNCIQFIKNQTEKMQFIAFKQNPLSAKYFKNMSAITKMMVLSEYPDYINLEEYKLSVDDLMSMEKANSPKILLNLDKDVILEYLNKKYGN